MKLNQRGTLRINRTLRFLKMTHAWRKQIQTLFKTCINSKLPFSAMLLVLFSAGVACFFQRIIYQMPSFTSLDTSLLTCWVIGLFHWLKWRTSQVNKSLNVAVLHSVIFYLAFVFNLHALMEAQIQRLPRDQPLSLLGDAGPKAGSSYFPSAGSLVYLWCLQPCLGSLHNSSALKEDKILLPSSMKLGVCLTCSRVVCNLLCLWLE